VVYAGPVGGILGAEESATGRALRG
jgi:hypothetical protein